MLTKGMCNLELLDDNFEYKEEKKNIKRKAGEIIAKSKVVLHLKQISK